jgi:hypothetical protein
VGSGEGLGGGWLGAGAGLSGWGRVRWQLRRRLNRLRLIWMLCVLVGGVCSVLLVWCSPVLAVSVGGESVSDVASSSATLRAAVEPTAGSAASYHFEYGPSESYGVSVPEPEGEVSDGSGVVAVEAHLQGLMAHTTYYFRVVASSGGVLERGVGETFTTQPAGGELVLPDGRVWELVSPARKDGALIPSIESGAGIVQAAEDGGAITYTSNGPVEAGPAGNANETQVLSVRHAGGGWSSRDITTPNEVVAGISIGRGQEYRAFSSDLSVGLVQPFGLGFNTTEAEGAVPLSEGASEATPYLRADPPLPAEPGSSEQRVLYGEAEMEGGYLPLVVGCPAGEPCKPRVEERANAPPGVKFGGHIVFLGADADLSHVIFRSREVPLVAGAEPGLDGIYEWAVGKPPGEQLSLVSVLPDVPPYEGKQANAAELGNANEKDARGAVSSDGSRIVWSYEGHLFMRYVLSGAWQSVQLDVGGGGSGRAKFQFASSDGSKVFFTDEERLTVNSKAEARKPELYECEMVEEAGALKCDLSDLTPAGGESADVQGLVLAGNSNSSYLYLVANGVLTSEAEKNEQGEKAQAGADNLYMLHYDEETREWKPTFIAILSEEDGSDWSAEGGGNLETTTSRVSPDGEYLVFMSERGLTGYNNVDVNSGVPDEEVYLYGAPSVDAPSGRLVCVSCNPTDEQPAGVLDSQEANEGAGLQVDRQKIWDASGGRWLAGYVPGWTGMERGVARYQSRYVLDDGRVFFDSPDGLVPQATNGLMDVYEYEPVGVPVGSPYACTGLSSGFSAAAGGCIGLISSGSSDEESAFLDASAGGGDVFFWTSAPLVPADQDTAFDVYDAHACSALASCSSEAVVPPPCGTAEGCRVSPPPQPSVFGASGSATFAGPGNAVSPGLVVKKCARGKKLSGGKCVKVKAKKAMGRGGGKRKSSKGTVKGKVRVNGKVRAGVRGVVGDGGGVGR